MRCLIFSDVHWSTTSSIITKRSKVYSVYTESLINSLNWVNEAAVANNCDCMICAGDFFDKSVINSEEVSAVKEIKWNDLPCYFLCGNHEASNVDLSFNLLKLLEGKNHYVISDTEYSIIDNKTQIHFLPYITEDNRESLENYINKDSNCSKQFIISHNDIAGIHYNGFESKVGFSLDEIKAMDCWYLNGHLHNTTKLTDKIINVGCLLGHNFLNDSSMYKYGVWVLDTEAGTIQFIENPFGFKIYKRNIFTEFETYILDQLDNNTVLSITTRPELAQKVRDKIAQLADKIVSSKVMVERTTIDASSVNISDLHVSHLDKFVECCKNNLNNTEVLLAELTEICK